MGRSAKAETPAAADRTAEAMMGSFFAAHEEARRMDAEFDAMYAELDIPTPRRPSHSPQLPPMGGGVDVPISVGRRR